MITGLAHVSIVVPSLDAAAERLEAAYGLVIGEVKVNAEQGVGMAYVELGNARLEIMEPSRPDSPVAKFLERNPAGGIHHFSLQVDDRAALPRDFQQLSDRLRQSPNGGFLSYQRVVQAD